MRVRIGIVDLGAYESARDPLGEAKEFNGSLARFGFCWFRLKPCFRTNGGSLKKHQVVDMSIQWLCFGLGMTIWGNQ